MKCVLLRYVFLPDDHLPADGFPQHNRDCPHNGHRNGDRPETSAMPVRCALAELLPTSMAERQ